MYRSIQLACKKQYQYPWTLHSFEEIDAFARGVPALLLLLGHFASHHRGARS